MTDGNNLTTPANPRLRPPVNTPGSLCSRCLGSSGSGSCRVLHPTVVMPSHVMSAGLAKQIRGGKLETTLASHPLCPTIFMAPV